jgi:hypothetical protein
MTVTHHQSPDTRAGHLAGRVALVPGGTAGIMSTGQSIT